jgi:hypothetical protein
MQTLLHEKAGVETKDKAIEVMKSKVRKSVLISHLNRKSSVAL